MKCQPRILAGTALGLLMASTPLAALPLPGGTAGTAEQRPPLLLAQAECQEGESAKDCAVRLRTPQAEQPAPAENAAPSGEQAAPAEPEQAPREKKRRQREQQTQTPAEEQPALQAEQPAAPAESAAPSEEQAAPAAPEQAPREKKRRQREQQTQTPAEEQPAPQAEQPAAPAENAAPSREQAAPAEPEQAPREKKRRQREQQTQTPAEEQPAPQAEQPAAPAENAAPSPEVAPTPTPKQEPAGAEPAGNAEQPAQAAPSPEAAPILDSQKEAPAPAENSGAEQRGKQRERGGQPARQAETPAPADQGPPPADDRAAQQAIRPEKIEPVTEEKGKRVERAPNENLGRRPRPEGADVLKELGDRVIIRFGDRTMVESDERPRMRRGAKDVYYEDLPRGQTRETIVRGNGDRVVTIRNRNGDIIRRSRITLDGREYILSYVDQSHYEDVRDWRDPGDDLPPLRLDIPRNRYILDAEAAHGAEDYYDFLEQPPVERVRRLYSIDEVKRSARVRDIARRVDLDTLNFDFGSAAIGDSEVQKLQGVADAMERLLRKNPAETFLIEGHTDAVGSDTANLALSDRRAEAVAEALTNVFDIPPENLTTQGYGERYLKVNTQSPARENRRVAIRRITPLVAPAVSAN